MSIEINRKKSKSFWLTFFYRLHKLLPISKKAKFKLFLQWEWIFDRLAHEASFQNYSEKDHPFRIYFYKFILNYLPKDSIILDILDKSKIKKAFDLTIRNWEDALEDTK